MDDSLIGIKGNYLGRIYLSALIDILSEIIENEAFVGEEDRVKGSWWPPKRVGNELENFVLFWPDDRNIRKHINRIVSWSKQIINI